LNFPERNNDIYVFWHYGLNSEIKDGSLADWWEYTYKSTEKQS
jgi:hypothetical protein